MKRTYIENSHITELKKLAEGGQSYARIAQALNKKGIKTTWGSPIEGHHVGFTLNSLGIRRKAMPSGAKRRGTGKATQGGGAANTIEVRCA